MDIRNDFVTVNEKDGGFEFSWAESSSFTTDDAMKETVSDYEDYTTHAPTADEKAYFFKTLYNSAARIGFTEGYSYCARRMKGQTAEQAQTTTAAQVQNEVQEKVNILAIQVLDEVNIFDVRDKLILEHPEYMLEECIFNIDRNEIQMYKPLTVDDTDPTLEIQECLDRKNINARIYEFDVVIEAGRVLVDFMMDGNFVKSLGFKGKFNAVSRKVYE